MNANSQHLAEAIERADIADREHLGREHTKALMDATKQALRHVGNTGRV